jgi:uncharacterized small protein (DUF1192 family)
VLCLRARCCRVTRSRLTEERALSSRQLMLVHSKMLRWLARPLLPKGWTAGGFKTSGDVEAQRVSLQALGNRLAGLGIFSFLCKCVSSATSYFARDVFAPASVNFEAIMFLATTLTVQAIPSAMTLLLLSRFHFSGDGERKGTLMQSLLPREDVSLQSDSAATAASNHQSQLASDNARLQEEIARLKAGEAQKASDNARLQEENARLKAQMPTLQQAK